MIYAGCSQPTPKPSKSDAARVVVFRCHTLKPSVPSSGDVDQKYLKGSNAPATKESMLPATSTHILGQVLASAARCSLDGHLLAADRRRSNGCTTTTCAP